MCVGGGGSRRPLSSQGSLLTKSDHPARARKRRAAAARDYSQIHPLSSLSFSLALVKKKKKKKRKKRKKMRMGEEKKRPSSASSAFSIVGPNDWRAPPHINAQFNLRLPWQ